MSSNMNYIKSFFKPVSTFKSSNNSGSNINDRRHRRNGYSQSNCNSCDSYMCQHKILK